MATSILSDLLARARPSVEQALKHLQPPYTLFFSVSDGSKRARVCHARGNDLNTLWLKLAAQSRKQLASAKMDGRWLRIDWVTDAEYMDWGSLHREFKNTKRGYFRYGLALDADWKVAFLEQELNGNAMLYGGNKVAHAVVNHSKFRAYTDIRFGPNTPLNFDDEVPVTRLHTEGLFVEKSSPPQRLYGPGRNAGRRIIDELDQATTEHVIQTSSRYLASQVLKNGRFEYGWHCCFDRPIGTYNTLRHASSTYAMTEGWEVTRDEKTKQAIDRALKCLTEKLIKQAQLPTGEKAAFLVEANGEIKLGGNAVCILALVKYIELSRSSEVRTKYSDLLEQLARGIHFMQDAETGKFVHVLQYPSLSIKEAFRIIYYDGEAAFGLMRLYGLTKDTRWLSIVEKAFEYFIANNHWQAHDHWLSYCVNELTLYRPEARYYQFGIQNVIGHLDFIIERITTFPTLLELMMAAERMVTRLRQEKEFSYLLNQLDLKKFYFALHTRAMYLLNGYFWPEYAMFFQNPEKIVGSFYIRHHAFRVRIDDVEHYLSGFVAFTKYLRDGGCPQEYYPAPQLQKLVLPGVSTLPILAWAGDVNLSRRQHYRTQALGEEEVLGRIPALSTADLSVINLECVVATTGEQGIDKAEGAPYYYRARPEMLQLLCRANIDAVTTANNHSGDYGTQALLEQGFWLDSVGIAHTGTGVNLEAALRPIILPLEDLNVAIFSLDATQQSFAAGPKQPGSAYLPLDNPSAWAQLLKPHILRARQHAQVVLVAVHWGGNLEAEPRAEEYAVGHHIIDAGADGILGTSAHVLQGIEIYKNRPIIHDAGDLLFDAVRKSLKDSGVFQLSLSHKGVEKVRFFPVGSGFGFSHQRTGNDAVAATRRFADLCINMGTALQPLEDGSGEITLNPPQRDYPALPPARKAALNPVALQKIQRPISPHWAAREVPSNAIIPPMEFGPLQLIGLRYTPKNIEHRQLLYVETFWTLNPDRATQLNENIRLDIRAVPIRETDMPCWGKSMDHDPCDWQLPTSRWKPGMIYRDYYGLRPPAPRQLRNVDLRLEIGLIGPNTHIRPVPVPDSSISLKLKGRTRQAASADGREPPHYRNTFPACTYRETPGQTWNAQQLTEITKGEWLVPPPAGWFVRSVVSGRSFIEQSLNPVLFVAHKSSDRAYHERSSRTKYTNWDLHNRLPDIAKTAGNLLGGVIVERPVSGLPTNLPVLQVKDPIQAIIELGLAARNRFRGDVIAITGTAGKSSTLKMLANMLGTPETVLASLGNYNSRVGAPSMLASLSSDRDVAIMEVAQSALWMRSGPITRRICPTIALITGIGISQTSSRVKSTKDTARWKSRIFEGLVGRSIAIVNEQLLHFDYVLAKAKQHAKRVIVFGTSENAEVRIMGIDADSKGSHVTLKIHRTVQKIYVPAPSMGMVQNAVAALCAVYALGRSMDKAARSLENLALDDAHLSQAELALADGTAQLIDDSWNATISSMLNAFSVLAEVRVPNDGRKIAALGRIVDLGEQAATLHRSLAQPLLASGAVQVITHGEEMHYLRDVLPEDILGPHFSKAKDMARYLASAVRPDDLLLIKGSRRDSDFGSVATLLNEFIEKQELA
ncbi:CapA family protein [Microbulbifer agarilyticus]|uniref:CapA family protein n=1 Tax=Microbulbifer agarilyticus TaxID=260552 RepID=UPI001CD2F8BD|nr:CapA family protein [Microbulbifer agarilyticus]MCA0901192.1 CapA family protein [Microbulbifer agarilyticus]